MHCNEKNEEIVANENGIVVYIAAHKQAKLPSLPGRIVLLQKNIPFKSKIPVIRIDDDAFVSSKSFSYCELSTFHWVVENSKAAFFGLEHYRRFFLSEKRSLFHINFLMPSEISDIMKNHDIIVPKKEPTFNNTTVDVDYHNFTNGCHFPGDFEALEKVIKRDYPDYINSFNKTMYCEREMRFYNMMIGRRAVVVDYAHWAFSVLEKVEKEISLDKRSTQQKRVFGYLGELLPNIWLENHPEIIIAERNVMTLDRPLIDMEIRNFAKKLLGR
jgi:hypothetical protein